MGRREDELPQRPRRRTTPRLSPPRRLDGLTIDTLVRIKRAVIAGRVFFTRKATEERESDDLAEEDVREAIINAPAIYKSIRSTSPRRGAPRDPLHIIYGTTFTGIVVYTKGKLVVEAGIETYYVLVSAKRSH